MDFGLVAAFNEARIGLAEGGIPIGSSLVIGNEIIATGRNRRVQDGNAVMHAEVNCIQNAGRLTSDVYRRATLYTTLSPCEMCAGTALLFRIPRIVVGENRNHLGAEDHLVAVGVEVTVVQNSECIEMMAQFISSHYSLWMEDIGEPIDVGQ